MDNKKFPSKGQPNLAKYSDYSESSSYDSQTSSSHPIVQKKAGNATDSTKRHAIEMEKKMEVASNKDVDIGLELLTNPEKKRVSESTKTVNNFNYLVDKTKKETSSHEMKSELDMLDVLDSDNESLNRNNMDKLLHEMENLEKEKTSQISQSEINKYIASSYYKDPSTKRSGATSYARDDKSSELSTTSSRRTREKVTISHHERNYSKSRAPFGGDATTYEKYPATSRENRYDSEDEVKSDRRSRVSKSKPFVTSSAGNQCSDKESIDISLLRKEKENILRQLERYRRLGATTKRFNLSIPLEELKYELESIKDDRERESSVKFQRASMLALTTGIEMLNSKFDPFGIDLNGWAETVSDSIDEYTEVFEELHEKYGKKSVVAPELKLLMLLGGSAVFFHVSSSMLKGAVPTVQEVMRNNPDLQKAFASAAVQQMPQPVQNMTNMFGSTINGVDSGPSVMGLSEQSLTIAPARHPTYHLALFHNLLGHPLPT